MRLFTGLAVIGVLSFFASTSVYAAPVGTQESTVTMSALQSIESATTTAEVGAALTSFLGQYDAVADITCGIVVTQHSCAPITGADLTNLRATARLFVEEWSKYPVDFVTGVSLGTVYFAKNLKIEPDARAAIPSADSNEMFYDIDYVFSPEYMRGVIHHEFEHYVEYKVHGTYYYTDASWGALNPAGFTYGNGGASCYEPDSTCLTGEHPIPGFVTGYGSSGIEEDRAELFAYMFTSDRYVRMNEWAETDTNLAQKIANYRVFLLSLSSSFDDAYFGALWSVVDEPVVDPEEPVVIEPALVDEPALAETGQNVAGLVVVSVFAVVVGVATIRRLTAKA